jgi:hypothetical protein
MANNKSFFEAPQAAAIYKHELLKRYIPAWTGKGRLNVARQARSCI